MSIYFDRLYDQSNVTQANLTGISWAHWAAVPAALAPGESGTGLTTDANGKCIVPSTATSGYVMLWRADTEMGIYEVP